VGSGEVGSVALGEELLGAGSEELGPVEAGSVELDPLLEVVSVELGSVGAGDVELDSLLGAGGVGAVSVGVGSGYDVSVGTESDDADAFVTD